MNFRKVGIIIFFFLITIIPSSLAAATNVFFDGLDVVDLADATYKYQRFPDLFFSKNDEVIPTAFAMVNTMGYPNGKSVIEKFPHFEFGLAAGAGLLEYSRMDDYTDNNPTVPFGGFNGGFHFGTGITDKIDVTFKVFVFSLDWLSAFDQSFEGEGETSSYKIDIDNSSVKSFGLKMRYNLYKRKTIYPIVYTFGGVSLNLGFDYMGGKLDSTIEFRDVQEIELDIVGNKNVNSIMNGSPSVNWKIYTITPEALVYFDFLYVFSLYTGPTVSFNFGEFNFDVNALGTMATDTQDLPYLIPPEFLQNISPVGVIFLRSNNKMKPKLIIPKWTLGLELNVLAFKIQLEAAAILTSIKDSFTAQVGTRLQF